jgi:hypothetical protein
VEDISGSRREVESGRGIDQTPAEIITEAFKGLGARIDEISGRPRSFSSDEIKEIREMLEAHKRQQWLLKRGGMFLLAVPALAALWQGLSKLLEWIRNP